MFADTSFLMERLHKLLMEMSGGWRSIAHGIAISAPYLGQLRSDEVVIGTTEREVKARTVHRKLAGQRGDARCAKSLRGVPWQPSPAEAAEGEPLGGAQARIVSVPIVPVEHRPAVPVMEPRDYKVCRFCVRREVALAKYGFSDDCEGCRVVQSGAEGKLHSEGCRERIRQAVMKDDVGQQRLHAAEQRLDRRFTAGSCR